MSGRSIEKTSACSGWPVLGIFFADDAHVAFAFNSDLVDLGEIGKPVDADLLQSLVVCHEFFFHVPPQQLAIAVEE